jgi:hypothetical protein
MINIVFESNGFVAEEIKDKESVYLLRGYAHEKKYPAAFEWICVALINDKTATIKGLLHTKKHRISLISIRRIYDFLRSLGCNWLIYERIKDGVVINVTRKL